MSRRRIVSKHWLRRMARLEERYLREHVESNDPKRREEAAAKDVYPGDELRVERAGRVRARWVVIAE
jgi:hypothetical protein